MDSWEAIDRNNRGSLTAVSSADNTTIVRLVANPTTGALLVEDSGGGGVTTTYVDLSTQTNGVTKTFTIPSGVTAVLLTGSDAPIVYRPVVDYTISGTTLTLDAGVNAPSSGSTLILVYTPGVNPPVSGYFTTVAASETVNGITSIFTFSGASQPLFIVADNVMMRATTSTGDINWTWNSGTHQATMTIPPQDDIVAVTASVSSLLTATETVNGSLTVFTFASATSQPAFVVSDNLLMEAVANDGTINWTWNSGSKQATMAAAPQDDIVALSAPATGVMTATELVNGSRTTFTFASAAAQPSFVVQDGAMMRATTSAGTVNWTWNSGTLQATLTATPTDDVIALV